MEPNENTLRRSRQMYMGEAALEYLISILVGGSFLATLTKELGMSDSLTGILSSVVSLGCLFQLLSMLIHRNRTKPFVIALSAANQLLFLSLYVIPLTNAPKQVKIALFIAAIFLAYLLYYLAHPKKINWLMSLVDDSARGRFTANKEILSLIAGIVFSYTMGAVVDRFAEKGQMRGAFIVSAVVIFLLTALHTLSMILSVEKPLPALPQHSMSQGVCALFQNKAVLRVTAIFVLYYISTYCATPFYGTYQINELGLSLKTVTALTIVGSVVRIAFSKFWGRYADEHSFLKMLQRCLPFLAVAYLFVALATPKNGIIMFAAYYILHGIAQAGVSSALINLVFDYVPPETRSDSLALCQAASGVAGFLATLSISPLVGTIQQNGNRFLGIPLYAQQVVSVIACLFLVAILLYLHTAFHKSEK